MTINNDHDQSTTSTRILPNALSSDLYQLHTILSPLSEKLLNYYDQCANNGEFPFTDEIQTYLNDL